MYRIVSIVKDVAGGKRTAWYVTDGNRTVLLNKEQLVSLINRSLVENAKIQVYQGNVIIRYKEELPRVLGNIPSEPANKTQSQNASMIESAEIAKLARHWKAKADSLEKDMKELASYCDKLRAKLVQYTERIKSLEYNKKNLEKQLKDALRLNNELKNQVSELTKRLEIREEHIFKDSDHIDEGDIFDDSNLDIVGTASLNGDTDAEINKAFDNFLITNLDLDTSTKNVDLAVFESMWDVLVGNNEVKDKEAIKNKFLKSLREVRSNLTIEDIEDDVAFADALNKAVESLGGF